MLDDKRYGKSYQIETPRGETDMHQVGVLKD